MADHKPAARRLTGTSFGLTLMMLLAILPSTAIADTVLAAAVLPSSRSVQVNNAATLFVTLINGGTETANNCRIESDLSVPSALSYQTTDPATNLPTGTPGTPVDLEPGGSQSFLVVLIPTQATAPTEVALGFLCDNAPRVPAISGVNTFDFSASTTPVADIVALGLTPSADGIIAVPTTSRINAFSVASINLGAAATIEVTARPSNPQIAATVSMCQTDPLSGVCINPTAPTTAPVVTEIGSMETPTFAVFVTTNGTLAFDPAASRINVRFSDETNAVRGATSVAVSSRELLSIAEADLEGTTLWSAIPQPGYLVQTSAGQVFAANGTGTSFENSLNFGAEQTLDSIPQDFNWAIDGNGELQQQYAQNSRIERLSDQTFPSGLREAYGLPDEQSRFLEDLAFTGQLIGPLEVERNLTSRTTTATSRTADRLNVTSTTTVIYTMNAMLTRNGWTGTLPEGTPQLTTATQQIRTAASVAQAPGQIAADGDTWAVPFLFVPQDTLNTDTGEGFFVDALTLQANGTTAVGRLSAESATWENQNNTLVLTSGDEEYRYTTLDLQDGERIALIEVSRAGTPILIAGRPIALSDTTGMNLAGELITSATTYWQAGLGIWGRDSFDENGQFNADLVFGYQFIDSDTSKRIFTFGPGDSDCIDENLACYVIDTRDWTWTSEGNFVVREFSDASQTRARTWEVMSYTAGGDAVVLESETFQFETFSPTFLIPPRLNSLKLEDLQNWPAEFANSPGFN